MFQQLVTISTFLILLAISTESVKTTDTNTKAASPYTNCGCQCSNLTFKDKYGKTHGNCKSSDHTGAVWCYVDPNQSSSCQDLSYTSVRFPGKPWSYEACATPVCYYNNGGVNNGNNGGYNNGGSNNGGYNNGGSNNGGYNNGGSNNGGYNNGGLNNGGYNNGGYNNGGSSNGGYNNGGSSNGGYNNGYNSGSNGGYNTGSSGYNNGAGSANCKGTKCLSGSGSNSGSYVSGLNGYNSGSYGSGSNLGGILSGRSKTEDKDSVKFGS